MASALVATPLLLHFGMIQDNTRLARRVAGGSYLLAGLVVIALGAGLWRGHGVLASTARLGPLLLPYLQLQLGPVRTAAYAAIPLCLGVAGALFARRQRRDGRPTYVTYVTTTLMAATAFNDILGLGAGRFATVPMFPFAFSLFGLAVGFSVVSRYGHLAAVLEQRTTELRNLSGELSTSLKNLSATRKAVRKNRQLAVVGGLIEELANELNDPLEKAGHALAAFREESQQADARLDELATATTHINRLVSDLLSFARPIALEYDDVDLEVIIKNALSLADAYPEVDVSIACALPWPHIEADANKLQQVFERIIVNALEAVHQDGELRVDVRLLRHNGRPHVRVEVRDTGQGMAQPDLRRALAPFFSTRPDGTGFGLPICKRVVETHGGELEVESVLDVGTLVRVLLPTHTRTSLRGRLSLPAPPLDDLPVG